MSKNLIKITSIGVGVLFGVYLVFKLSGILQTYVAQTTSSAPEILPGDWIFASSLKEPKHIDLICFEQTYSGFPPGIWIKRLVALEGDKLELIDGVLFVNGKNQDKKLNTIHSYWVDTKALPQIEKITKLEDYFNPMILEDSTMIHIEDKEILPYMNAREVSIIGGESYLFQEFNPKWTKNNFGPIIIPKNKGFVLGDNRDGSIDSRHIGCISLEQVVGVRF